MSIKNLIDKEIHLIGISGAESSSVALFLINLGCRYLIGHDFSLKKEFKKNYFLYHQNQSTKINQQQTKKIINSLNKIYYGNSYLTNINQADIIFAPASWFRYKINRPLKKSVNLHKLRHWYNLLLDFYSGKIIGVTGTAGKGTTTNLIYLILKAAKKDVYLFGESWLSLPLNILFKAKKNNYIVAELSNRTLTFAKYSKKSPHYSIVTNIFKNHLDDHQGSFKRYVKVKKEIARYQTKKDYLILNKNNQITFDFKNLFESKKILYSYSSRYNKYFKNSYLIGKHLISDAIAAIKLAKLLKITDQQIIKGIKRFKPRPGRMQLVKKINNILFINDAASTRPEATIAAIKSFNKRRINLILEGSRSYPDKHQFENLINSFKKNNVNKIAVSGQISNFILPLFKKAQINIIKTNNLTESFNKVIEFVKAGEVVMLSPACESFGEFKDYRARVNKFNQLVESLNHD